MIPCLKRLGRWSPALIFAASSTLLAQNVDIPLRNWTAPPFWTPPRAAGAVSVMDLSNPLPFIPTDPCRIADTRGFGFTGQAGPPILQGLATRTFQIAGTVPGVPLPGCGIPLTARAVSFQFTVIQPGGAGNLIAWPSGAMPSVSVLNWEAGIFALGNGIVVPISTSGALNVFVNAAVTTHLTIDVNGYYYDSALSSGLLTAGEYLGIIGDRSGGPVILGRNNNPSSNSSGVQGEVTASGAGSAGVYGLASATSGVLYGLLGKSGSVSNEAAGVKGVDSGGGLTSTAANLRAGVRGDSASGVGVMGLSRATGVVGTLIDSTGNLLSAAYLGYAAGANAAVYAVGDISATGMKFFVEPHPSDPSKVIRYVALEGPEAGTYFRGTGHTTRGHAEIDVPESFRLVTDEEGLTVQLTPVGELVQLAIIEKSLNKITVRSSRDVAFDYEVKGVRRSFRNHQAIGDGAEFIPSSPEARLPIFLTEEARSRLISNGTYREDGSVNMTTAERLGWTALWEAARDSGTVPVRRPQTPSRSR